MKIYEYQAFPHPRRVRMFLAEKGIKADFVQINVPEGEHRSEAFVAKNPSATVPLLELDDGTYISESVAISTYFETLQPKPALMGETPKEKANIEMWQRRMDNSLMATVSHYFHHATQGLGQLEVYQNKEWGEKNKEWAIENFDQLNIRLTKSNFVAGNAFSIADITAICATDFALFLELISLKEYIHLNRWYQDISSRKSAQA